MNSNALAAQKMVVNVRFDQQNFRMQQNNPNNRHARHSEMYDIKEHELLVCRKKQRSTDGITRVQSAHDGEDDWDNALGWHFFGVSDNEHRADLKYRMDQGLAVVVGGICKAFNDSGKTIHAGAYLTYTHTTRDIRVRGVPPKKKRFTFVEYDPSVEKHRKRGVVAKALNNARQHGSMDVLLLPSAVTMPQA
tara:strand:+ start:354 stop:929 length:576 start_codon:yes stop_codon:yes gene_type:complete